MLFFKSLAVLSTLAFGALSGLAAPAGTTETGLVARCDCDSLPNIIAVLKDDISVSVGAIAAITPANCTVDALTPVVVDIKAKVNVAITAIGKLSGQPLDVVIGAGIDVNAFAAIVADLVVFIFTAIRVCLTVCVGVNVSAVLALLCGLGEVIGALIVAILHVCAGLFVGLDVAIFGLIGVVVDVIVKLNVSVIISVFGIVL
ncbi:hypothetical protein PsYK624_049170 [Phanerochaete sordida]|uniref:Hydrophobin n=1 Tax=Phanerochaete sordida TaxID=48140 RepID=A0A9P3G7B1_9APHY|nr:hypothetical protein PsYK624_049170 [Phanerochaete sordida]